MSNRKEDYFARARFVDDFLERDEPDFRDVLAARLAVVAACAFLPAFFDAFDAGFFLTAFFDAFDASFFLPARFVAGDFFLAGSEPRPTNSFMRETMPFCFVDVFA